MTVDEWVIARSNTERRFGIMSTAFQDLADAINKERELCRRLIAEKDQKITELQVPVKKPEEKKPGGA